MKEQQKKIQEEKNLEKSGACLTMVSPTAGCLHYALKLSKMDTSIAGGKNMKLETVKEKNKVPCPSM